MHRPPPLNQPRPSKERIKKVKHNNRKFNFSCDMRGIKCATSHMIFTRHSLSHFLRPLLPLERDIGYTLCLWTPHMHLLRIYITLLYSFSALYTYAQAMDNSFKFSTPPNDCFTGIQNPKAVWEYDQIQCNLPPSPQHLNPANFFWLCPDIFCLISYVNIISC